MNHTEPHPTASSAWDPTPPARRPHRARDDAASAQTPPDGIVLHLVVADRVSDAGYREPEQVIDHQARGPSPMNSAHDRLPASEELAEPDTDVEETVEPATTAPSLDLAISYPVPTVCVVKAVGELDMLSIPTIADCVGEQVAAGPVQLVIDLQAVTFLGSTGMGTLLECSRWLEATVPGSTLHLSGTHRRNIHRPLELVGLLPLFNAHTTLAEALAQLGARPETPPTAPTAGATAAGSLTSASIRRFPRGVGERGA